MSMTNFKATKSRRRVVTVADIAHQFMTTVGLSIIATVGGLGFAFASHVMM